MHLLLSLAAIAELLLVDVLQPLATLPVNFSALEVANRFKRLSCYSTGGSDFIHALVTASHICCEPHTQCPSRPNKKFIHLTT